MADIDRQWHDGPGGTLARSFHTGGYVVASVVLTPLKPDCTKGTEGAERVGRQYISTPRFFPHKNILLPLAAFRQTSCGRGGYSLRLPFRNGQACLKEMEVIEAIWNRENRQMSTPGVFVELLV